MIEIKCNNGLVFKYRGDIRLVLIQDLVYITAINNNYSYDSYTEDCFENKDVASITGLPND